MSKLRIDLSHKTERLRFNSGTQLLNFLTAMHSYLSSLAENAQA